MKIVTCIMIVCIIIIPNMIHAIDIAYPQPGIYIPPVPPPTVGCVGPGIAVWAVWNAPNYAVPDNQNWVKDRAGNNIKVLSYNLMIYDDVADIIPTSTITGFCKLVYATSYATSYFPGKLPVTDASPMPCWRGPKSAAPAWWLPK